MILGRVWLQTAQKDLRGEARDRSTSGGVLRVVRGSEAIERNEAYESFSAVWSGDFVNAAGMNAVGADQCTFHLAAEVSSDPLKIRAPRTLRFVVGVTHVITDRAPLAANGTNSRHRS
jgi:hypothetical protein